MKSNTQVSGALTTSRGPATTYEFALSLVEQLFGEYVAKEVGELLVKCSTLALSKSKIFCTCNWLPSLDANVHLVMETRTIYPKHF